jgi:carbon-monoxide dehydrogenase medium subunit
LKPSVFSYVKPATLSDALGLLSKHGEDAQILAGGQSLVPTLNMRLSSPDLLVDINGLDELSGVRLEGNHIRIGALTRHVDIENSSIIAEHCPLIALAMPHIAHPAIRNRGTFGGSIALADPAAELPACMCALEATIEVVGNGGTREIAAKDFFKGLYETELENGEIVTAVAVPIVTPKTIIAFDELSRRHGDYAMAGLAVSAKMDDKKIETINICYFAISGKPILAEGAAKILNNGLIDDNSLKKALEQLEHDLDPLPDLYASSAMKMHYSKVLFKRNLEKWIS